MGKLGPALRVPVQLGGWIHYRTVTVQSNQGCSEENSTHGSSDPVTEIVCVRRGFMEKATWRKDVLEAGEGSSKLKLRRRLGLQPK